MLDGVLFGSSPSYMSLSRFTRNSICALGVLATATPLLIAEEDMPIYELSPVTVTAPRFVGSDIEVAARVEFIDRQAIEESGASNIVELLAKEMNLHFRSTSGNSALSEVSIGGFGENSGQRVLVLLDGHRLNTADLGQINWLSIPLALVESVEVIKGGQSAIYGNNAVSGVIKIKTRRPTDKLTGQVEASYGSYDAFNFRAGVTGRTGALGFSAHVEHDQSDGYRDNSEYEAKGGGMKLEWKPEAGYNAYFSVNAVDSEYGLPGELSRAQADSDPQQTNKPLDSGEEESIYYRGGFDLGFGDFWTFAVDGGYTDREILSDYVSSSFVFYQEYQIASLSPSLIFESQNLTLVSGLDYYDEDISAASAYSFADYTRETLAGFASIQALVSDNWMLSGSARIERAENSGSVDGVRLARLTEDQYAWSLGLIRFIDSNARVYGTIRRFYRYPATDEIVISFPVPSFNPDIDPEWGHEVEIGGDIVCGGLSLGGRVFYQWMNDEIIYDPTVGLYGANANLDETRRIGVDLSTNYDISPSLDLSLSYTWVDAEIVSGAFDGSDVPLVPEHKVRLAFEYRPVESLKIAGGVTFTDNVYVGGDFFNVDSPLDDYFLLDASALYRVTEDLEVFLAAENLLDEEYISTAFGPDALYPGVELTVKVGVRYKF